MKNKFINSFESNLHIIIGSAPSNNLDFTHEINLLKTALLYADKVTLCSVMSSMLLSLSFIDQLSDNQIIELAYSTAQYEKYYKLKSKRQRTREEIIFTRNIENSLIKTRKDLKERSENIIAESHALGIIDALNSGIVELNYLDVSKDDVIEDYFGFISNSIISGGGYPLLDDMTGNLIEAAIKEGKIHQLGSTDKNAKHIGLTSNLFNKIPNFNETGIDEIIDIRKDLEKPLIRFRSAIAEFSNNIEVLPWDKNFDNEVDNIFIEKVKPSILEIDENFKSNSLLKNLFSNVTKKPLIVPSTSAIGFLLSRVTELSDIISQSISLFAGSTIITVDTINKWHEKNKEIKKNKLYFYYKLGKSLY